MQHQQNDRDTLNQRVARFKHILKDRPELAIDTNEYGKVFVTTLGHEFGFDVFFGSQEVGDISLNSQGKVLRNAKSHNIEKLLLILENSIRRTRIEHLFGEEETLSIGQIASQEKLTDRLLEKFEKIKRLEIINELLGEQDKFIIYLGRSAPFCVRRLDRVTGFSISTTGGSRAAIIDEDGTILNNPYPLDDIDSFLRRAKDNTRSGGSD